jgi:purine-nucleoside phosphorylase
MQADFLSKIDAAFRSLPADVQALRPAIGIVLGSGLGDFAERVRGASVPYGRITGMPRPTVEGHSGTLRVNGTLAVLQGRVHYYEGHDIELVVLPVMLLHRLGVRTLIVTNACGGINRACAPGDLVLIRDHINLMGVNPLRGPNPGLGPRFPDMSAAWSPRLRALAQEAWQGAGGGPEPLFEGVYGALAGPSYETPAEIRMLAAVGADLVGMSSVPEAIAARYLGIELLGVSCVTNVAAGILERPLDHQEVIQRGREAAPRFARLLAEVVRRLGGSLDAG